MDLVFFCLVKVGRLVAVMPVRRINGNNVNIMVVSDSLVFPNRWTHVAIEFVRDSSTSASVQLYQDTHSVGRTTLSANLVSFLFNIQ